MYNIYKLIKRKKGVSPVIAVVLLIALTVAAAAVIWAITEGIIGQGTTSFIASTTDTSVSASSATWSGTITVSESVTIGDVTLTQDGASVIDSYTINPDAELEPGEQAISVVFTNNTVIDGSYQLTFSYSTAGGDPQLSDPLSVTF